MTAVPDFVRARPGGRFQAATIEAPWGAVQVATAGGAVIGLAVHAPRDAFVEDVARRTGRELHRSAGDASLEQAVVAIEAFLDGRPGLVEQLPLDLVEHGLWDRAVLGGVRTLGWGEVTSYGRVAAAIGRRGAARAVGGAVGRNPIGLAIPCHRVIAGDGSLGGYGGDWFGGREAHLAIKRELLAMEGVTLPARRLRD